MATTAPMRDGPPAGSGTGGDSRVTNTSTSLAAAAATTTNFEYDDNEWEIGIGNLIIDLDADIEKTNEKSSVSNLTSSANSSSSSSSSSMAAASATSATSGCGSGSSGKANKSNNSTSGNGGTTSGACGGSGNSTTPSSAVEHSSSVENKSLKMKIKRTKTGSKSSEKHEIVKPSEQKGGDVALFNNTAAAPEVKVSAGKHSITAASGSVNSSLNSTNAVSAGAVNNCGGGPITSNCNMNSVGSNKRGSSSHRRDKTKDKHPSSGGDRGVSKSSTTTLTNSNSQASLLNQGAAAIAVPSSGSTSTDLNGIVRTPVQRVMFPVQTNGPGPPNTPGPPTPPPKDQQSKMISSFSSNAIPITCATQPTSCAQVTATSAALSNSANAAGSLNQSVAPAAVVSTPVASNVNNTIENVNSNRANNNAAAGFTSVAAGNVYAPLMDNGLPRPLSPSSPPCKKLKTANCLPNDSKETKDACVGTSISTMTEPDCLGPCEPGTSVTLEGIVWHETEGVLVVNVTWRGKTYVGTLLDCTRHDWAPPRFCDSPTSDLDARLPKGRAKRGRAATNDLSNFTETRSSVHCKLRSSSSGSNKSTRKGLSNSPTPFVSPRPDSGGSKRKSRPSEEESASPQSNGKKNKPSPQTTSLSPPSSPVFFECPEANCCKKYKHLNGLKYHQSHAHGGPCAGEDDDTTKESGSMSENEELPSPADPQSIKSERKDENSESEPATPISESVSVSIALPGSPHTQADTATNLIPELEPVPVELPLPTVDNKTVVKPGVLRYGVPPPDIEENGSQPSTTVNAKLSTTTTVAGIRPVLTPTSLPTPLPSLSLNTTATVVTQSTCSTSPSPPAIMQQVPLSPSPTISSSGLPHPFPTSQMQSSQAVQSLPPNPKASIKSPQFKVKPPSALMQDDRMKDKSKCQIQKKKSRKSPAGSPHSHHMEQSQYKVEEVHSPAYSDISDDGAPVLEAEVADPKNKPLPMDKKTVESSGAHSPHAMQHFNMYPFYGQPPFLVPSVQPDATKSKDDKAQDAKMSDKEKKDGDMAQKLLTSNFYSYDSYVPNYSFNLSQNYPIAMVSNNEKGINEENKSPQPTDLIKQSPSTIHPSQSVGQYSTSMNNKSKMVDSVQGKMQNESYGLVKDVPDVRNPMNASSAYLHARQHQQQQHQHQQQLQQMQQMQQMQSHSQQASLHQSQTQQQQQMQQQMQQHQLSQAHQQHQPQQQQPHEDMRRYYGNMYSDQRRKEQQHQQHTSHSEALLKATPPPNTMSSKSNLSIANTKHKEKQISDEKKEDKTKQEGVKPTMETQGPPPPPTSSYAYFTPGYIQSPYMPFDAAHPMYRTLNPMMVPTGPYGNSPYLPHPAQMHPQMPRYHAPEDLSRQPSGSATKALDLLHHQASQYYPSSHKIHELQERAIKSPTPKSSITNPSPSAGGNGQPLSLNTSQLTPTPTPTSNSGSSQNVKSSPVDGKDSRSPPPQRHVHTHHHTHVGLGYPLLAGQYGSPYGAAVLASEQAAAVASAGSNPYSPK